MCAFEFPGKCHGRNPLKRQDVAWQIDMVMGKGSPRNAIEMTGKCIRGSWNDPGQRSGVVRLVRRCPDVICWWPANSPRLSTVVRPLKQ